MKHLKLTNRGFEHLREGFGEWLDILGYSEKTIYNMPNYVHEFLHRLEGQGISHIKDLEGKHVRGYHGYIESRPNQRRGGALSDKSVLMHMQAVEKFLEYLHHRGMDNVPASGVRLPSPQRAVPEVLTAGETASLFAATRRETADPLQEALNARDRVMLVIYYSCGLRRNEGVHVGTDDINLDTRVLHVRKGKNHRERFVPFNAANAKYLEEYIYGHRPPLIKSGNENRLFVTVRGKPMTGGSLYVRLRRLQGETDDPSLREKAIGLHTLRHSIATHLLGAGMGLEKIARFLGHSTLESTQIYTHILKNPDTRYDHGRHI